VNINTKSYTYLLNHLNSLPKQHTSEKILHTLTTVSFPTYVWFLAHIKNLKIEPYHPVLTTLLHKVPNTSVAVRTGTSSSLVRNVLSGLQYRCSRFYSKSAAFSALKKSKFIVHKRSLAQFTIWFHTGVTWNLYHINALSYYKMMGIGPQKIRLADEISTVNTFDKNAEPQNIIRNFNNANLWSRRLKTNVAVQHFLSFVKNKTAGLGIAPMIRLRAAYKTLSFSKRNIGKIKDKPYQKPYAFVGLKKTPKSLIRNPFQTMFVRALRISLASSKTTKLPNQFTGTRFIYRAFDGDRSSKLRRFTNVSTLSATERCGVLGYWPKKQLRAFLKLCGSRLPARLPKLVTRQRTTSSQITKPYSSIQFTSLKLRSMSIHGTASLLSPMFKNHRAWGIASSARGLHKLADPLDKASLKLSRPQLFRMASSPLEFSNRKTFSAFTSALAGWCERIECMINVDFDNLRSDQYTQLSTLFNRSTYLLLKFNRIRFRKSAAPTVIKLWLGCFNMIKNVLRTAQNYPLLFHTKKTYPTNGFCQTYHTTFNILKTLRLRKHSHLSRQNLQPHNHATTRKWALAYLKTLNSLYKVPASNSKFKKSISLASHDLWKHISTPAYLKLGTNKDQCHQTLNLSVSKDKLRLPIFRSKLSHTLEVAGSDYVQNYLKIRPLYASSFTRSPFFFYNLFNLRNLNTYDLVIASNDLRSRFSSNVFPTANDLKVSIFRRLNHQKLLAQSRILTLNSKSLFYKNALYGQSLFTWPLKVNQNSFSRINTTNNLNYRTMLNSFDPSNKTTVRIRRVRFKPGYGRIWRQARSSIREILNIHAKYQYRLTPKLQIRYFQARKNERRFSTFDLGFAIMTTHLAPDVWSTNEFLANGYVFLNGECHSNPSTKLFIHDFIQLVVNIKFYITLRWLKNWSLLRFNRITKVFYRKFRPSVFNKNVKTVRELPTWFYGLQYTYCDIPKYFEVDYFTLSIFVVHNRLELEKWMPTRADLFSYEILNMYNWKYIT